MSLIEQAEAVVSTVKDLLQLLKTKLEKNPLPQEERESLAFADVVGYLSADKSKYPDAVRGAAFRYKSGDMLLIAVVFLNKEEEVVGGNAFKVKTIDDELSDMFDNKDLVVFE